MTSGKLVISSLVAGVLLLFASSGWAWVWTDGSEGVEALYACSDSLHPDDEDAPEYVYESIRETGAVVGNVNTCDDCVQSVSIGFAFPFYEAEYESVNISSNGFLTFTTTDQGCCSGDPIPNPSSPNGLIAFCWDDLCPGCRGGDDRVFYQTVGEEGSRRFIVEFHRVPRCCSDVEHVSAQVILFESTGEILMHMLSDGNSGRTTTIGIENPAGTQAVSVYHGATNAIAYEEETIYCSPLYLDADEDGFGPDEDCDDSDPDINPDADEVCDGVDNDCSGEIDDDPLDGDTFFLDADDDGFGIPDETMVACEVPDGYADNSHDCDDSNGAINPDAEEVCDGDDNDCDDEIDEGVSTTYFADYDHDGYGDPERTREACSLPAHHVANSDDCDDAAAAINPDAVEVCDTVDNDCDDDVDEGVTTTYYEDFDRDSYGDPDVTREACSRPAGYVSDATDCDDVDRDVYPGAPELCDELDNDCNDLVDDGATTATFYADADGDGHGDPADAEESCTRPEGRVTNADDCDDSNETVHPLASEICDELDNNCNAVVDEGVTTTYWEDMDDDGFGDPEVPMEACEMPEGYVDNTDDCDDTDEDVFPGADEECNGIDDDCDGETDEDDVRDTFYLDSDGDGFGDEEYPRLACVAPEGYVDDSSDCDDGDELTYPGAEELCDGVDNDCNETIDDGAEMDTFWADDDGDGYGDPDDTVEACVAPEGYTDDDTDCDDTSSDVHPNAPELADELDNDCDDEIDEGIDPGGDADADADGDVDGDSDCDCSAVGQVKSMTLRSGLLRLVLSWTGLL